jgi:hypothetical protein
MMGGDATLDHLDCCFKILMFDVIVGLRSLSDEQEFVVPDVERAEVRCRRQLHECEARSNRRIVWLQTSTATKYRFGIIVLRTSISSLKLFYCEGVLQNCPA